jgi:hypothetical protein
MRAQWRRARTVRARRSVHEYPALRGNRHGGSGTVPHHRRRVSRVPGPRPGGDRNPAPRVQARAAGRTSRATAARAGTGQLRRLLPPGHGPPRPVGTDAHDRPALHERDLLLPRAETLRVPGARGIGEVGGGDALGGRAYGPGAPPAPPGGAFLPGHDPAAHLPGWEIEVVASDLSTRALDEARAAVWSIEQSAGDTRALLEGLHDARRRSAPRGDDGGTRAAGGRAFRAREPPRRTLRGGRRLRPHLLPQRPHLFQQPGPGRGGGPPGPPPGSGRPFVPGPRRNPQRITDELRSVGPTVYGWPETARRRGRSRGTNRAVPTQRTGER